MDIGEKARQTAIFMQRQGRRTGKMTVFVVLSFPAERDARVLLQPVRETFANIVGTCEIGTLADAETVLKTVDGLVDAIVVDVEQKVPQLPNIMEAATRLVRKSTLLTYKDNDVWVNAVDALIAHIVGNMHGVKIGIVGLDNLGPKLALKAAERCARVFLMTADDTDVFKEIVRGLNLMKTPLAPHAIEPAFTPADVARDARVLIGATIKRIAVTAEMVENLPDDAIVVAAGIGTIEKEAAQLGRNRGLRFYRFDNRAGLSAEIVNLLETRDLVEQVMGETTIDGVRVVAGGIVGEEGTVIVDSVSEPGHVIGIADGTGRVRYTPVSDEEKRLLRAVEDAIRKGANDK
ncbi:MAG: hypothetical protein KAJ01_03315 [Candidatus Hydrogenedentes bacterium]|nr:hypothetical protein [Candidatus Hydrogenedentota bacterium]